MKQMPGFSSRKARVVPKENEQFGQMLSEPSTALSDRRIQVYPLGGTATLMASSEEPALLDSLHFEGGGGEEKEEEGRDEGRRETGGEEGGKERKRKKSRPSVYTSQTGNYPNTHQLLNVQLQQAAPLGRILFSACMLYFN